MKKEYDFSKGKRGAVIKARGKTRITIHLDDDVIDAFRVQAEKAGRGYQTLINDSLRKTIAADTLWQPSFEKMLRKVIR